jgi:hypothetical protein
MTTLPSLLLLVGSLFQQNIENVDFTPSPKFYGKLQYAGNIGLVSVGAGTILFKDRFSMDLSYGYLPKIVNGAEVNTLALKPTFYSRNKELNRFKWSYYTGFAFTYSYTKNTYIKYPDHFPNSYYMSNAFHFNPYIGLKVSPNKKSRAGLFSLYTEVASVDYKIYYAFKSKRISPLEIWNVCFGITFPVSK